MLRGLPQYWQAIRRSKSADSLGFPTQYQSERVPIAHNNTVPYTRLHLMKTMAHFPGRSAVHLQSSLCLSVALLFSGGCSPKEEPTAIGNWKSADGKTTMNLHPDGTLSGTDEYGRQSRGTFQLIDDQHIKIVTETRETNRTTGQISADKSEGTLRILVQADSLLLTEGNGSASRFKRIK
jgi:hypothetical protein